MTTTSTTTTTATTTTTTTSDTIRIERLYRHSPARIWRALTDPELHAQWWAKGDVRPVVGHRFTLDMGKWGQQECEVLEVVHERRFRFIFARGVLDTTITWELTPETLEDGEGCRLVLVHAGFKADTPMGRQALEGMANGWPALLERLQNIA